MPPLVTFSRLISDIRPEFSGSIMGVGISGVVALFVDTIYYVSKRDLGPSFKHFVYAFGLTDMHERLHVAIDSFGIHNRNDYDGISGNGVHHSYIFEVEKYYGR